VVEAWAPLDTFDGLTAADLLRVQRAIQARCDAGEAPRYSDQSTDWAGLVVACELGFGALNDRKRIKKLIEGWLKSGALVKTSVRDAKREMRPCIEVGEWATE
jgi:hypothetical protein